jgi:membrane protein implicated in regulation of membrane protease activity
MGMLTLTYILFAAAGCLYVLIAAFLGHASDFVDFGHAGHVHAGQDAGGHAGPDHGHGGARYGVQGGGHGTASTGTVGHPVFHFPFFSPLAIATLIAAIGGFGLIGKHGLGLSDGGSLLLAVPAALATAYGVTYAGFRLVSGARASSVIRMDQIAGSLAEVTAPIPAGGVGEALAMVGGQRYAAPAREVNGGAVPRGAAVTVVGMAGPTLLVQAGSSGNTGNPGGTQQGEARDARNP